MPKNITPRLIPALLAVAFSGSASASGFALWEQNASGLGNAFAGSAAVADNASTIYFNPAGMTRLRAREFSLGANIITTSFQFQNDGSRVGAFQLAGDGGDGGGTSFVPAVRRIFESRFGKDRIESGGEMISVASGLALLAGEAACDR